MDETATLSEPYRQFAKQYRLTYVERGTSGWTGSWGGNRTLTDFVGGALPGGTFGMLARAEQKFEATWKEGALEEATLGLASPKGVRLKSTGEGTDRVQVRDSVMLMTRVPEAALFLPSLSCREAEARDFVDRMVGPGGWIPIMEQFELESIEFNRRYRIGIFRGGSEMRVRRLFSPTFIDWMASTAPPSTLFELWGGFLTVTVGGLVADPGELEQVCLVAGTVAERIRSEALEDEAIEGPKRTMTSLTPAEQKAVTELDDALSRVEFDSPPTEVGAASRRFAKVAAEIGRRQRDRRGLFGRLFLGAFHRSVDRNRARRLALEAVTRGFAGRHGLERGSPTELVSRVAYLLVPLGRGLCVLVGDLPGTRTAATVAVMGDRRVLLLALVETQPLWRGASVRVMPKDGRETLFIGGYPIFEPRGVQALSASDREAAARGDGLAAGRLSAHYEVIVGSMNGTTPDFPDAATSWLLHPARLGHAMLVADGGTLALLAEGPSIEEFSAGVLDDFCTSVAPVAGAFGAT